MLLNELLCSSIYHSMKFDMYVHYQGKFVNDVKD